jgi:DNA primase
MTQRDIIDQIKGNLDIVSVVSEYVRDLKQSGNNHFAKCPFHSEKTPSFSVNSSLQRYKCFGCGESGDAITFIQKMEATDFVGALRIAAKKAGISLDKLGSGEFDSKQDKEKKKILKLNQIAAEFFHYILLKHPKAKQAREYIKKRDLKLEQIQKFKIGFAPPGYQNLRQYLLKKGYSDEQLLQASLIVQKQSKKYDKFRNRIMFPVFDLYGQVCGFSGRVIDSDDIPKYLNSAKTVVFEKSHILYGLFQAKQAIMQKKFVILVEGNVDILSAHKVGIENIAAPMGTSLTKEQLMILKRYTQTVYFCFDSDSAGLKALERSYELAQEASLNCYAIDLHGAGDLDDFIRKYPTKAEEIIPNAKPVLENLIQRFSKDTDFTKAESKSLFVAKLSVILTKHSNEIEKVHYANEIASLVGVDKSFVLNYKGAQKTLVENTKIEKHDIDSLPSQKFTSEMVLLSFLIQFEYLRKEKISGEVFSNFECSEIFSMIKADSKNGLKNLTEKQQKLFEDLSMYQISDFESEEEVKRTFKKLYAKQYHSYISDKFQKIQTELKLLKAKGESIEHLLIEQNKLAQKLSGLTK